MPRLKISVASSKAKKKSTDWLNLYWEDIRTGKTETSDKVKRQMAELIAIKEGSSEEFHYDPILANRPIIFIEKFCKQSKGNTGKPVELELFEKAIICSIFGFVDNKGYRMAHEIFIDMGRKNGKSTLIACISLYCFVADGEGGPEIDCVSTKRDAARIVFNEAKNMVLQSPELRAIIKPHVLDLYCEGNLGMYRPLSSDANTLDGLNPSVVVADEIHAWPNRQLYDVTKQALSAESRKQPLYIIITTAGFVRDGIYDELYDYAEHVLNKDVIDYRFISFIYELDSTEEWLDESKWIKANPGLGTIKSLEKLRANVQRALVELDYRPTVWTKDFNLKNVIAATWLKWEQIDNPATFDMELIRNTYAIAGADLSAVHDLTCATLLIRRRDDDMIYLLQHYFIPESKMEENEVASSKEAPYEKWRERGLLTVCPGEMVKYSYVTAWYKQMKDEYQIDIWKLGYDRAMADYWVQEMINTFGDVMESVPQGAKTWTMPMKEMGAVLSEHGINYNNNPIFKWCLSNTAVKSQGTLDSIEPVKIQRKRRIDGMVSALNAYVIYVKYRQDYLNMVG